MWSKSNVSSCISLYFYSGLEAIDSPWEKTHTGQNPPFEHQAAELGWIDRSLVYCDLYTWDPIPCHTVDSSSDSAMDCCSDRWLGQASGHLDLKHRITLFRLLLYHIYTRPIFYPKIISTPSDHLYYYLCSISLSYLCVCVHNSSQFFTLASLFIPSVHTDFQPHKLYDSPIYKYT